MKRREEHIILAPSQKDLGTKTKRFSVAFNPICSGLPSLSTRTLFEAGGPTIHAQAQLAIRTQIGVVRNAKFVPKLGIRTRAVQKEPAVLASS